ncbi:MAG TPA: sulfatase [Phycisphaerae bacterium]|nr:sulfatase [Phycisphaerae bacterium]
MSVNQSEPLSAPDSIPRWFTRSLAAVVLGWATSGLAETAASSPTDKRPNVLVIFNDQLRTDACGVYGGRNITTPSIDRLAREGVTFDNALSTCPLCTPYRGMLQTGRYPTHTGLVLNWVEVNPRQRAVAHVFRDAGYQTGFIGKWHLAAGARKRAGKHAATREDRERISKAHADYQKENPETEYVPPGPARLGYEHWQAYNFHSDFHNAFYYEDTPKRLFMPTFETDAEIDMTIAFMRRQQEAGKPFFLMVAPHPPHPPFSAKDCPAGYLEKIRPDLIWSPNVPEDHQYRRDQLKPRCYFAMCKNFDDNLGRLLDFMDRSGLAKDTVLVVTSDHGEMLGSHGRINKMVPYREAVNIPCIVRWPGHIPAGRRLDVLQTPMDHFPTLCGLAGIEPPSTCDGLDLSGPLLGTKNVDRDAVLMMNYVSNWDYFDSGTTWPEWRGLRTQRYTYAKWLDGKEELYDNRDDPWQMKNLADNPDAQPVLKKLRPRLAELLAEAHDEFLPGTAYADWYDDERVLVRTALGPVEP